MGLSVLRIENFSKEVKSLLRDIFLLYLRLCVQVAGGLEVGVGSQTGAQQVMTSGPFVQMPREAS